MTAAPVPTAAAARVLGAAAIVLLALTTYLLGGRSPVAQAAPASPSSSSSSSPTGNDSGVEVVGTGEVAGTPDVLRLQMQVSLNRPTATAALDGTSIATAGVVTALKARKVAGKDIKTNGLSLQPNYDYRNGGTVLRGYIASEDIAVTLRDLRTAGAIITAAAAAGGNATRIQGVSLDLDGDSALLAKARDSAIADARTKAQGYARAAGRRLGAVRVISESTTAANPIALGTEADRKFAAPSSTPVPVQAGSQQISVSVRVVWSFG